MSKPLIYLASPRAHPDKAVRQERYEKVRALTAELLAAGHHVFSPIVHSHTMAEECGLEGGFDFWKEFDLAILERCDELWVYCLPGWQDSVGVKGEIEFASSKGKAVVFGGDVFWEAFLGREAT